MAIGNTLGKYESLEADLDINFEVKLLHINSKECELQVSQTAYRQTTALWLYCTERCGLCVHHL